MLRKLLDPDFRALSSGKAISYKKYRIYLLTIIKVSGIIAKMENFPNKTALKLIIVLFKLFAKLSLTKKNFPDHRKVTEKRFELLKAQLKPGMTDKEVKQKIAELIQLRDPKSWKKYLQKWRDWEKKLYESTK